MQVGSEPVGTVSAALATGLTQAQTGGQIGVRGGYTDSNSNTAQVWYNVFGQPVQTLGATGGISAEAYNSSGFLTSSTDALGNTTNYTVNANGQDLSVKQPDGSLATYVYGGADSSLTKYTDYLGHVWTYTNDSSGRQTSRREPAGEHDQLQLLQQRADNGLLETMTNPKGVVTTYSYDSDRRPTGELVAGAVMGTIGYDTSGNPNTFTDALGNVTTSLYNKTTARSPA